MTRTGEPEWLTLDHAKDIIETIAELYPKHRVTLVRPNDLAAALERPVNRCHYSGECDLFVLASDYVYGIGKAHALVDGNKRLAFQAALVS